MLGEVLSSAAKQVVELDQQAEVLHPGVGQEARHPGHGAGLHRQPELVHARQIVLRSVALVEREVDDDAPGVPLGGEHPIGQFGGVADVAEQHVDAAFGPPPDGGHRTAAVEAVVLADPELLEQHRLQQPPASPLGVLVGDPLQHRVVVDSGQVQGDDRVVALPDGDLPDALGPLPHFLVHDPSLIAGHPCPHRAVVQRGEPLRGQAAE